MTRRRGLTAAERVDWLRLCRTPNIGPVGFAQLIGRYATPGAALDALPALAARAGRKRPLVAPSTAAIEDEIAATEAYGARIVASCEPDFPQLLRALDPPPPVLTMLGSTAIAGQPAVAIVGARNASAAGRKIARDIAAGLGGFGYAVVSGLARGIDGEAHAATLETGTVAVLGGGVDHIYPPQHERLYAAIAQKGLIVSESPFGHRATARDFPRRNRLITGLALGAVIVEAAERSGSLISARTAGEQGREVMAVPGSPLDPRAAGVNRLLRQGATLVRDADDVLEAVRALPPAGVEAPGSEPFDQDGPVEAPSADQVASVREALGPMPLSIDEIARASGVGAARCAAILLELELAGVATTLPGGLACLAVE